MNENFIYDYLYEITLVVSFSVLIVGTIFQDTLSIFIGALMALFSLICKIQYTKLKKIQNRIEELEAKKK